MQLGRDLNVTYKTAFVLAHKLREAMAADQAQYRPVGRGRDRRRRPTSAAMSRQENYKADRKDRRLAENQSGKRRVVVVMRERQGRTLPFVVKSEDEAVPMVRPPRPARQHGLRRRGEPNWDALHARFDAKRINHSFAFSTTAPARTKRRPSSSRLRRAEFGQHHRISGPYLQFYAGEMAWREDMRRDNGTQFERVGDEARPSEEPNSCRYWQRHTA